MKRSKLLVLTTVVLAMLMLFTACGKSGDNRLKDILLDDATYTDSAPSYTLSEKVSDLTDASVASQSGELVCFTKSDADDYTKTKYFVYNVATGSIVWSDTQTATYAVDVDLNRVDCYAYTENECSYFVVTTVTTSETEGVKPVTATTLYTNAGEKVVTVDRAVSADNVSDLIYVDGKMYHVAEDGKIAYAFDYSPLADIPSIETKYNDQYYELDEEFVAVYDNELKFVSKYRLPVHLEDDGEVTAFVMLENGNMFLQYMYVADTYSDDYDLIMDEDGKQVKYMVATQLINVKKGTAKEIDCEYVFEYAMNMIESADEVKEAGIDAEKIPVYGVAYLIENKRLADERALIVENSGKCKELGTLNGDQIQGFSLLADGCWMVSTQGGEYLVDKDGKIIGDVSNASTFGKFLYADGKIYDAGLNMIYDYGKSDMTIKRSIGDSLLMEDADGQLLLYTGSGDPITLIDKDSEKTFVTTSNSWEGAGYIVLKSGEQYEIYNDVGTKLGTVNDVTGSISSVVSTEKALLVRMQSTDGEAVYYRFS